MTSIRQGIWLVLLGLAIGWMVGLSISAVVASVITTLLALAGAVVTVFAGIKKSNPQTDDEAAAVSAADPAPIALLAVAIALAATAGAFTRLNVGVSPDGGGDTAGVATLSLFSVAAESCDEMLRAPDNSLTETVAQEAGNDAILAALGTATDPARLRAAITQLCSD